MAQLHIEMPDALTGIAVEGIETGHMVDAGLASSTRPSASVSHPQRLVRPLGNGQRSRGGSHWMRHRARSIVAAETDTPAEEMTEGSAASRSLSADADARPRRAPWSPMRMRIPGSTSPLRRRCSAVGIGMAAVQTAARTGGAVAVPAVPVVPRSPNAGIGYGPFPGPRSQTARGRGKPSCPRMGRRERGRTMRWRHGHAPMPKRMPRRREGQPLRRGPRTQRGKNAFRKQPPAVPRLFRSPPSSRRPSSRSTVGFGTPRPQQPWRRLRQLGVLYRAGGRGRPCA